MWLPLFCLLECGPAADFVVRGWGKSGEVVVVAGRLW
jgi:hypothetical protein